MIALASRAPHVTLDDGADLLTVLEHRGALRGLTLTYVGDDLESLTPERGAQLLQEKRDKGPAPPKRKAAAKRKK